MECNDYNRPKLAAIANGATNFPVKIGSDNPDNLYQSATISGRKAYLVKVKRNTVHYLGFGSQSGSYGSMGGLNTVDYKESVDFKAYNGEIEILISPENFLKHENYLKTSPNPENALLIVRQTFVHQAKEVPAEVSIQKIADFDYDEKTNKLTLLENQHDEGVHHGANSFKEEDKLTCEQLANALNTSALFVAGSSMMFAKWASDFQTHINKLPLFNVEKSNRVGGDPYIRYYHSYWKLDDDEVLVIKATPPKKLFTWNFQVNNHWMESLDYRYYQIHVNMGTANYRSDGSVCILLTLKDPEVVLGATDARMVEPYNWLSTTGHNCGTMCFRWIRPEDFNNLPQPETAVCKLKDLKQYL